MKRDVAEWIIIAITILGSGFGLWQSFDARIGTLQIKLVQEQDQINMLRALVNENLRQQKP